MKYFEPYDDQQEAIKFMISRGAAGVFADPGKGKTGITLTAFKILQAKKLVKRMVVIAPQRICHEVWPDQVKEFDGSFGDFTVGVVAADPNKARRQRIIAEMPDILCVNPESLNWFSQQDLSGYDMLVVDESTRMKSPSALCSKILKNHLMPKFKRRYILTGTPVPNGLMDLFGQVYILDFGEALGRYITKYRDDFFQKQEDDACLGSYADRKYYIKPGADERIYEKLRPLVIRLDGKVPGLPDPIYNPIKISMTPKIEAIYRKFEEEMIIELGKGEIIEAVNAAALTQKCRQVCNGGVYYDEFTELKDTTGAAPIIVKERKLAEIHTLKNEAALEIVESLQGSPAMIAYEFHHDLARLQRAFPKAPHAGGDTKPAELHDLVVAWNKGDVPVMLVQAASVAHGLNLQKGPGHNLIVFSLNWNWETTDQLIRRLWRNGQQFQVMVHWLMMRNTVDETMFHALKGKDRTQMKLLNALKDSYKVAA